MVTEMNNNISSTYWVILLRFFTKKLKNLPVLSYVNDAPLLYKDFQRQLT